MWVLVIHRGWHTSNAVGLHFGVLTCGKRTLSDPVMVMVMVRVRVRVMFAALAFVCAALIACTRDGNDAEESDAKPDAWARFATTGRYVTAPLVVGDDVVVGITTRGVGAMVDERGAIVDAIAGDGGARDATCVLVRFDADGSILWQVPVRADDAQSRCSDVHLDHDGAIVARGETFDVDDAHVSVVAGGARALLRDDESWSVVIAEDGLVVDVDGVDGADGADGVDGVDGVDGGDDGDQRLSVGQASVPAASSRGPTCVDGVDDLDAPMRMDSCTPALAALSTAFTSSIDGALDALRINSPDGYAESRGVASGVAELLVPQGAALDALVPGAVAPAVDESTVESVATVMSLR